MGKFSADFKTQEKSFLVASDPRYFQYGGDAWICNGTTDGSPCTATGTLPENHENQRPGVTVSQNGSLVSVGTQGNVPVGIRLANAQGRVLGSAEGACIFDTRGYARGIYVLTFKEGSRNSSVLLSGGR